MVDVVLGAVVVGVSSFSSFGSSFSKSPNSVMKVRSGTETDGSIVFDWKN